MVDIEEPHCASYLLVNETIYLSVFSENYHLEHINKYLKENYESSGNIPFVTDNLETLFCFEMYYDMKLNNQEVTHHFCRLSPRNRC